MNDCRFRTSDLTAAQSSTLERLPLVPIATPPSSASPRFVTGHEMDDGCAQARLYTDSG